MYWFQIINLSFTGQNSATFDAKVAEFFIKNKWVITANPKSQDISTA